MTTVYLHPTITAALTKAEQKLGPGHWVARNPEQAALVANLPDLRENLADLPTGMIEAIGSTDAEVINTWLAERGYTFRLQPLGDEDIGVAASLDVTATWAKPGSEVKVTHEGKQYPAVKMEHRGYTVYAAGEHRIISPQADQRVFMVMAPDLETGLAILHSKMTEVSDVDCVTFPMIDHDAPVDLSWLVDMEYVIADNTCCGRISQAVGQAKLRMNEYGARAKTGAAAAVYRSVPCNVVTIDKPFVLAFMHKDTVLAAFHLTTESWMKPPNLGESKPDRSGGKRVVEIW